MRVHLKPFLKTAFAFVALLPCAGAHAADTPFDWHELAGTYDFGACKNVGEPIWDANAKDFYVLISTDPFNSGTAQENDLGMLALRKDGQSVMASYWDISGIGEAPQVTYQDPTGTPVLYQSSMVIPFGVESSMYWQYPSEDSGFASVKLIHNANGTVYYEMIRTYAGKQTLSDEQCTLISR